MGLRTATRASILPSQDEQGRQSPTSDANKARVTTLDSNQGDTMPHVRIAETHPRRTRQARSLKFLSLLRAPLIGLSLVLQPLLGEAYEADVHYGLTKWLALKAGFSEGEAKVLASANYGLDGPVLSAVPMVALSACLRGDAAGANRVREDHFATDVPVPSPPSARKIKPGSEFSITRAMDRIRAPLANRQANLMEFGTRLHAVQDTWSHKHEPDVPHLWKARCRANYAWSHSRDWNGWRSHDADLTSKRPGDAIEMAKMTYDLMCRYRDRVDHAPCKRRWEDLSGDVARFSELKTKRAKIEWFAKQAFSDTSFVRDTNMDDDDPSPKTFLPYLRVLAEARSVAGASPKGEVGSFVLKFLESWARTTDFDQLVEAFIDPDQFGTDDRSDNLFAFDREVAKLTLQFWRALDHGRVAALGHNVNLMDTATRNRLVAVLRMDSMLRPYEDSAQALVPVAADRAPFGLEETASSDGTTAYTATLRFRHARHDVLAIGMQKSAKHGLRIRSIQSLVDH